MKSAMPDCEKDCGNCGHGDQELGRGKGPCEGSWDWTDEANIKGPYNWVEPGCLGTWDEERI